MTKKNTGPEGDKLENDSEPLKFEEASSLFEETSSSASHGLFSEEPVQGEEESPSETKEEMVEFIETQETLVDDPMAPTHSEISEDLHTIGAFLKQIRIEKDISIKIISQHTKISTTNLIHLEADDLEKLPNRAYVIGYVKSYSKILKLNQDDCLELLDSTYGIEKVEPKKEVKVSLQRSNKPDSKETNTEANESNIKIGIIIGVLAVGAFLLILRNTGKDKVAKESPEEIVQEVEAEEVSKVIIPQTLGASTPLATIPNEEVPEKEKIALEEVPEKATEVKVEKKKEETISVAKKEKIEKKADPIKEKIKKKKEEKLSFRPLAKKLYAYDSKMTTEEINNLLPSKYRATVVEGQHNVFINAFKADSWLTYKSDDGPIKKFILRKGRTILIRGNTIRVYLGNLGSVKVFRNNKPLLITSPSSVKSLVFPQEEASKFVIPLFIYKKDGTVQTSEDYLEDQEE